MPCEFYQFKVHLRFISCSTKLGFIPCTYWTVTKIFFFSVLFQHMDPNFIYYVNKYQKLKCLVSFLLYESLQNNQMFQMITKSSQHDKQKNHCV